MEEKADRMLNEANATAELNTQASNEDIANKYLAGGSASWTMSWPASRPRSAWKSSRSRQRLKGCAVRIRMPHMRMPGPSIRVPAFLVPPWRSLWLAG